MWEGRNYEPKFSRFHTAYTHVPTLHSGIDVPPGITVAPPLKKFHITILILFYINLGIAIIFNFFFFKIFQKLISVPPCLFWSLEYFDLLSSFLSK